MSFNVTIRRGSRTFFIPIRHGVGLHLLEFEDIRIQRVMQFLYERGRRGVFIDIGANTGQMFLNLSEVASDIPYLGFEPSIEAACYIDQLLKVNAAKPSHIMAVALGSEVTSAVMYANSSVDVSATLTLDPRPAQMYKKTYRVSAVTADSQLTHLVVNLQ